MWWLSLLRRAKAFGAVATQSLFVTPLVIADKKALISGIAYNRGGYVGNLATARRPFRRDQCANILESFVNSETLPLKDDYAQMMIRVSFLQRTADYVRQQHRT